MNGWRDSYNPIRGLAIAHAAALLEAGERGAYADLQWLYRSLERRDEVTSALLSRFEGGILRYDWDCVAFDASDLAAAQLQVLRAAYERIDNLRAAITFLVSARFRGFAHLERHYRDGNAKVAVRLEPVPQWLWIRKGPNSPWEFNQAAKSGVNYGQPINPANFIIREFPRPINEIGLISFVRKSMAQKDWDAYVETFGIPPIFVEGPPNVPTGQEEDYQAAAEAIISNSRGYLPHGSDVITLDHSDTGGRPFKEHIRCQMERTVLAGTSGLLTMLTVGGDGGGGQAHAHHRAWLKILAGEATLVQEVFRDQFDRPLLQAAFPGQPVLAGFSLGARQGTGIDGHIAGFCGLAKAGYRVAAREILEKTGFRLEGA